MHIVGIDDPLRDLTHIHTIDIWFSERRQAWIVERLNGDGDHMGLPFVTASEAEARVCVADWLRAHSETYLTASGGNHAVVRSQARNPPRRAA